MPAAWQLSLTMTLLAAGKSVFVDLLPILLSETWAAWTSRESPEYLEYWGAYVLVSVLVNLLLASSAVALLVLFLARKRALPRFISIFYAFAFLTTVFDALSINYFANQLADFLEENAIFSANLTVLRNFLVAVVWISYFRVSKRVKNTFVLA